MQKNKKSFTLMEIMIVVIIVGILSTIAIPSFHRSKINIQSKYGIAALKTFDSVYMAKLEEDKVAYQCGPSQTIECKDLFKLEILSSPDWTFSTSTTTETTYEGFRVSRAGVSPSAASFTAVTLKATNVHEPTWSYSSPTSGTIQCFGATKYCKLNKGLYE